MQPKLTVVWRGVVGVDAVHWVLTRFLAQRFSFLFLQLLVIIDVRPADHVELPVSAYVSVEEVHSVSTFLPPPPPPLFTVALYLYRTWNPHWLDLPALTWNPH
jgi:hypothetical protein